MKRISWKAAIFCGLAITTCSLNSSELRAVDANETAAADPQAGGGARKGGNQPPGGKGGRQGGGKAANIFIRASTSGRRCSYQRDHNVVCRCGTWSVGDGPAQGVGRTGNSSKRGSRTSRSRDGATSAQNDAPSTGTDGRGIASKCHGVPTIGLIQPSTCHRRNDRRCDRYRSARRRTGAIGNGPLQGRRLPRSESRNRRCRCRRRGYDAWPT